MLVTSSVFGSVHHVTDPLVAVFSRMSGLDSSPKKGYRERVSIAPLPTYFFPSTAAFRSFPALNAGMVAAATSTVAPVCGLRAVRAERSRVSNVPKPTICTFSSLTSVSSMDPSTAFTAAAASLSVRLAYWPVIIDRGPTFGPDPHDVL